MKLAEMLDAKSKEIQLHMDEMIPSHMHDGVMNWLWHGLPPGDFLGAVIVNNLKHAALCADFKNEHVLANWAKFFVWYMPSDCWGSYENASAWEKMGGWNGLLKLEDHA